VGKVNLMRHFLCLPVARATGNDPVRMAHDVGPGEPAFRWIEVLD